MNELNELFKVVAEGKKKNPIAQVKQHVQEDLNAMFEELAGLNEQLIKIEESLPEKQELTEEVIEPIIETPVLKEEIRDNSTSSVEKYLTHKSFQQPQPEVVSKDVEAIRAKIKFLEQAIGKIAATGPGSGEVWFRWLDDVDRSTIDTPDANQEHILRYNATTKKFFFGELTGDHREINSFTFDVNGPNIVKTPRMIYWNQSEDCLDVSQQDGTTLQVGLENYIQIKNNSGAVFPNGMVVRFSGIYSNGDFVPTAMPHVANGTIPPLYTIGVVTNPIPNGSTGRATLLGKVRDIDTTGADVGENWIEGDILYVHPTIPGKLTRNKPTAPEVVISIAVVLKKDPLTGILLVRPTIFPRLHYGTFVDKTNQYAAVINTPYAVTFNTTDTSNGHVRGTDTSRIIALESGLYNYKFSIQLVSTNSSSKEVYIWFRKNGIDIADSATRLTINGNKVYDVAAWDISVSMLPNDYFQIMWAVSDTTVHIAAPSATAFCPAIPSVILNVTEVAL